VPGGTNGGALTEENAARAGGSAFRLAALARGVPGVTVGLLKARLLISAALHSLWLFGFGLLKTLNPNQPQPCRVEQTHAAMPGCKCGLVACHACFKCANPYCPTPDRTSANNGFPVRRAVQHGDAVIKGCCQGALYPAPSSTLGKR
jgi:hypothetical protein